MDIVLLIWLMTTKAQGHYCCRYCCQDTPVNPRVQVCSHLACNSLSSSPWPRHLECVGLDSGVPCRSLWWVMFYCLILEMLLLVRALYYLNASCYLPLKDQICYNWSFSSLLFHKKKVHLIKPIYTLIEGISMLCILSATKCISPK